MGCDNDLHTPVAITAEPINGAAELLSVLVKVREAFPDLGLDEQREIAEWVLTGSLPLTYERTEATARELMRADGKDWDSTVRNDERNRYLGVAVRALKAGLDTRS